MEELENFDRLIDILRIMRSTNVGIMAYWQLRSSYGEPKEVLRYLEEASKTTKKDIIICPEQQAINELNRMREIKAVLVTHENKRYYPKMLRKINCPPPILGMKGSLEINDKKVAAIVGSRFCSINTEVITQRICETLIQDGWILVSGLARGVDTITHQMAMQTGTAAVCATGFDKVYPEENSNLFGEISRKGLVISEMPLGTPVIPQLFPRRNRIISGISLGVIVTGASLKSGSLITARNAAEQGREVFAVPGFPLDSGYNGCNNLIRQGANLIEKGEEAAVVLNKIFNQSNEDNNEDNMDFPVWDEDRDFSEEKNLILQHLNFSPTGISEILNKTKLPLGLVLAVLLDMELSGMIYRDHNSVTLLMEGEIRHTYL